MRSASLERSIEALEQRGTSTHPPTTDQPDGEVALPAWVSAMPADKVSLADYAYAPAAGPDSLKRRRTKSSAGSWTLGSGRLGVECKASTPSLMAPAFPLPGAGGSFDGLSMDLGSVEQVWLQPLQAAGFSHEDDGVSDAEGRPESARDSQLRRRSSVCHSMLTRRSSFRILLEAQSERPFEL
eukprot:2780865-Rhodomonas_salina.1